MRLKEIKLKRFKRFTDTSIVEIPETARLVVLTGSNGIGKSCIFEALLHWKRIRGGLGDRGGHDYLFKRQEGLDQSQHSVDVFFHNQPSGAAIRKALRFRSAYRHEADFNISSLERVGSAVDQEPLNRFIDSDSRLSANYRRLVSDTVSHVYSGQKDNLNVRQLREELVGELKSRILRVLPHLEFEGVGDPLQNGTFYFTKGDSRAFHFKNLSAGEKAVLDLLIDLMLARKEFDDTVFCIDEPESHLNARLQGAVVAEMFDLISANCQLWIATHSFGMLRQAKELAEKEPGAVAFVHLHEDMNFDQTVTIRPRPFDRELWKSVLDTALGDLADLVAPNRIVLCEGRPSVDPSDSRCEFDSKCLRSIFRTEFPDTDFASVGSCNDVRLDRASIIRSLQLVAPGTQVIRMIDRDDRSPEEITHLQAVGVCVLKKRNLEAYLYADDVLESFCRAEGCAELIPDVLELKRRALEESTARGCPTDDVKKAAGTIFTGLRDLMRLTGRGNDDAAFARDSLAKLITPELATYQELKACIFTRL